MAKKISLREQRRLAREMHDHLSQALGYLNVKASLTSDLLSTGRDQQAQESLLELKRVAKKVYTDVRETIFNLRTVVSPRVGLIPTLRDYLADYRAHYGVEADLVFGDIDLVELMQDSDFPVHARIDIRPVLSEREAAMACHASQLPSGPPRGSLMRFLTGRLGAKEMYMRAYPPAENGLRERDLFEGVSPPEGVTQNLPLGVKA